MKAKALILAALLGIGLASCSKEDDAIAPSNSNTVSDEPVPVGPSERVPVNNIFRDREFIIVAFSQNNAERQVMKGIKLNFLPGGRLEIANRGVIGQGLWGYSDLNKTLMVRAIGTGPISNLLSSDVWTLSTNTRGAITLTARHFEMSKQMILIEVGSLVGDPLPLPLDF
jgi:hypothetical protein